MNRTLSQRITLKVDVDTWRGTCEGVPRLVALLDRLGVRATFLFSLGPDHTGRALRRVFRRGFLGKVRRTSVVRHYGLRTLLYGVLLPGPHIGHRECALLRSVAASGHEVGVHCYDHVRWQDHIAQQNADWTRREMEQAVAVFGEVFGRAPQVHGAAGWQMNDHAFRLEGRMGFRYASDTRGTQPFWPDSTDPMVPCLQLPTTLPTLDELIGAEGITEANVHEAVLTASQVPRPFGHVYTLHAELEGMQLLPVLERLLLAWRAEGRELDALDGLFGALPLVELPRQPVVWGEVAGRSGSLAMQGIG